MQRRSLMKLGAASAIVLAVAGGGIALLKPGMVDGKLATSGRAVFRAVGAAILEGSLPPGADARESALDGLLDRVDALVLSLAPHVQQELSLLLSLLTSAPGRQAIAGLGTDWASASVPQVQQALQSMRIATISLRQQAYHALHDIVGGAYFSDAQTWAQLGYPGPRQI
jgi:hypothetical protein